MNSTTWTNECVFVIFQAKEDTRAECSPYSVRCACVHLKEQWCLRLCHLIPPSHLLSPSSLSVISWRDASERKACVCVCVRASLNQLQTILNNDLTLIQVGQFEPDPCCNCPRHLGGLGVWGRVGAGRIWIVTCVALSLFWCSLALQSSG